MIQQYIKCRNTIFKVKTTRGRLASFFCHNIPVIISIFVAVWLSQELNFERQPKLNILNDTVFLLLFFCVLSASVRILQESPGTEIKSQIFKILTVSVLSGVFNLIIAIAFIKNKNINPVGILPFVAVAFPLVHFYLNLIYIRFLKNKTIDEKLFIHGLYITLICMIMILVFMYYAE